MDGGGGVELPSRSVENARSTKASISAAVAPGARSERSRRGARAGRGARRSMTKVESSSPPS